MKRRGETQFSVRFKTLLGRAWLVGLIGGALLGGIHRSRANAATGASSEDVPGTAAGASGALPWTDANCGNCHQTDALFSHRVGVVPSMKVPENMPLPDGKMACATCHDNSSADLHTLARQQHNGLLRNAGPGPGFCAQCHDLELGTRGTMHAGTLGQAHLRWPNRSEHTALGTAMVGDGDSRTCLSCHDGTLASSVGGMPGDRGGPLAGSHPVGIEYRTNPVHGGNPRLSPTFIAPQMLDQRIRLIDGQVACASCHSPYSPQPRLLIMSNLGSKLCLSCHDDLP